MNFDDLKERYESKKKEYGSDGAYLHISEIFEEAREEYKREYLSSPKALKKIADGKTPDAEQSWKAFKGNNFERLVLHIIEDQIEGLGLRCIPGSRLERKNLDAELSGIYRQLLVRYTKWALLPDTDLVVFDPETRKVLGIISCKITLRERVAQTAYWKLKLASDPFTMHIKGYFVTADEDGDLVRGLSGEPSRNRIVVEHELDGTYVLREVSESEKVKAFPKFIEDLTKLTQIK